MGPHLCILSTESSASADHSLRKFAEFLGIQTTIEAVIESEKVSAFLQRFYYQDHCVLALHCSTLSQLRREFLQRATERVSGLLLYGFSPDAPAIEQLTWLTKGSVVGVEQVAGEQDFEIPPLSGGPDFSVSGQSFATDSGPLSVFVETDFSEEIQRGMTANGATLFFKVATRRASVFVLAGNALPDIDTACSPDKSIRPFYPSLLSMGISLRSLFREYCWHNLVSPANLIIDDPPLTRRYGCLDYQKLFPALDADGGALTIAFIPYNYRRHHQSVVNLATQHSDNFSIAVHGCDHTAEEYAATNREWLSALTVQALERMQRLSTSTGLPFDKVMVFPQGHFSTNAMEILGRHEFLAAVNSGPWPDDRDGLTLTLREQLDVAVTRFGSVPLFVRRYPKQFFDFAVDAFFQKPALIVEHHAMFKNGCDSLAETIRHLNSFGTKVEWMPLKQSLTHSYLVRRVSPTFFDLKCFTNEVEIRNPSTLARRYALQKSEPTGGVTQVLLGSTEQAFEVNHGVLRTEFQLAPGEKQIFRIFHQPIDPPSYAPSAKYRCAVLARRCLSDFRDNVLYQNTGALRVAEKLMQWMRLFSGE